MPERVVIFELGKSARLTGSLMPCARYALAAVFMKS